MLDKIKEAISQVRRLANGTSYLKQDLINNLTELNKDLRDTLIAHYIVKLQQTPRLNYINPFDRNNDNMTFGDYDAIFRILMKYERKLTVLGES